MVDPARTLRLFIALELPDNVRLAVSGIQNSLKSRDQRRSIRWTALESIHLTLKFLGATPEDHVGAIRAALAEASRAQAPFQLTVAGSGCFPNLERPRVVWAGVADLSRSGLQRLRMAVEQHTAPLGFPTEARTFSPHLTIGRTRQGATRAELGPVVKAIQAMGERAMLPASWVVAEVSLMQSDLHPTGAIYTPIARFALGGATIP